MRKLILLACFTWLASNAQAQAVTVLKYEALADTIARHPHKLLLVNYWATWCKPCVKELPYFVKIANAYASQGLGVCFVSLDDAEGIEFTVKPFLQRRPLTGTVLLLDEVDGNRWIGRMNPDWSGAIPATFIYGPGGTLLFFREGELTEADLETTLKGLLAH
jgi:thiol-disulfide isomerase/thioredoxin